jgi:hypothetical protein
MAKAGIIVSWIEVTSVNGHEQRLFYARPYPIQADDPVAAHSQAKALYARAIKANGWTNPDIASDVQVEMMPDDIPDASNRVPKCGPDQMKAGMAQIRAALDQVVKATV